MKVAVITPYHSETTDQLRRCHESVKAQTHGDTKHFMVADGMPHPWCTQQDLEHFIMPVSHGDAGATPRAIGSISAFARGYDAVCFLDADNWYEPDHVATMVAACKELQADGVIATRRIHDLAGKSLYVDTIESNGENMVDTNCMFLTRNALHLMTYWVTEPAMRLWSDRAFWESVRRANLRIAKVPNPTVAYVTKWAWHYQHAGVEIPPDAVWIDRDEAGNLRHRKQKDIS